MSLEHILLGYLREPASGYDLGAQFEEGAQHFWFAERSQIYPTLKRLRERGWLDCREEPSARGPRRKVYEITEEGRAELRRWLRSGAKIGRDRFPYIAQTFFLGELESFEESLTVLAEMKATWQRKLDGLRHIERIIHEEEGDWDELDCHGFHYYAALRTGFYQLGAKIAWCDETMERLRARQAADAVGKAGASVRQPGVAEASPAARRADAGGRTEEAP